MSSPTKLPRGFLQASQARLDRIQQLKQERANQQVHPQPPQPAKKQQRTDSAEREPTAPPPPAQRPTSKTSKASTASSPSKSKTLLEIERIRDARKSRRSVAEQVKADREGKDERDLEIEQYTQFINDFRTTWLQRVGSDTKKAESSLLAAGSYWKADEHIKVCVRKRPVSDKEVARRCFDAVTTATAGGARAHVYVHEPRTALDQSRSIFTHPYKFDAVFDERTDNGTIYQATLKALMKDLFSDSGLTASLFCYGATGSGAVTIFGPNGGQGTSAKGDRKSATGLYYYACHDIFSLLSQDPSVAAKISFFEIYAGRAYDLFNQRIPLKIMEDKDGNTQVVGLSEHEVVSFEHCQQFMALGNASRTTGATDANSTSSRSHAIFKISLMKRSDNTSRQPQPHSTLCLIDLAGSERGKDVGPHASQTRRMEGAEINKSLLALKECIRALHKRSAHIPFRGSKLTQILRDSFAPPSEQTSGKNKRRRECKCLMIVNISPSSSDVENTLGGLHYANRVKELHIRDSDFDERDPELEADLNPTPAPDQADEEQVGSQEQFYSASDLEPQEEEDASRSSDVSVDLHDDGVQDQEGSGSDSSDILGGFTEGDDLTDDDDADHGGGDDGGGAELQGDGSQAADAGPQRTRKRTVTSSPSPKHALTEADIGQLSDAALATSLLDYEDYVIERHIATLDRLVDFAKEEEMLVEQRLGQRIDMHAYVTTAEAVLEEKTKALLKLSKELRCCRSMLEQVEARTQTKQ
ncbi:hypothetical protein RI367_001089 [Sorochytrium milnesiophthora]